MSSGVQTSPSHVAVVMDGNGRWAQARGLPRVQGHRQRCRCAAQSITTFCAQAGIPYLTLFAFSSENWRRPEDEVSFLKTLLINSLEKQFDRLHQNNVRLDVIGDVRPIWLQSRAAGRAGESLG